MIKFFSIISAVMILFSGCKESKNILFCEGVDKDGKGVNCGTKFETGDLTAIIKGKTPFEISGIDISVYELENVGKPGTAREIVIEKLSAKVKPEETTVTKTLSFYRGGHYKVKAFKQGKEFADGDIEIVDY